MRVGLLRGQVSVSLGRRGGKSRRRAPGHKWAPASIQGRKGERTWEWGWRFSTSATTTGNFPPSLVLRHNVWGLAGKYRATSLRQPDAKTKTIAICSHLLCNWIIWTSAAVLPSQGNFLGFVGVKGNQLKTKTALKYNMIVLDFYVNPCLDSSRSLFKEVESQP